MAKTLGYVGLTLIGLALVAMVLGFVDAALVLRHNIGGWFTDWQTYALAAQRAVGGSGIYAPVQLTGEPYYLPSVILTGYAYPPASALLFVPFSTYPVGWLLWTTANAGVLLTGLWAIISRAWPRYRLLAFGLILLALANYVPFLEGWAVGNINVMLAGVVAWAWIAGPRLAPIIVAPFLLTKVPFAALAVWATRWGNRRVLIGTALALVLFVLVTLPVVGLGSWIDYVRSLRNATPICYSVNYSIACIAPAVGELGGFVIAGWFTAAAFILRDRFAGLVCAVAAAFAVTPDLHRSYWTIAVPLVVVALTHATPLVAGWRIQIMSRRAGIETTSP